MKLPEQHREIAHAWVDGAEIEWLHNVEQCWKPKAHDGWCEHTQYRVKQTPHSIDWSHVASHINAMVGFPSGAVLLLSQTPARVQMDWDIRGCAYINAAYFASFKRGNTDWKDSLVLRPMEATKTLTKEQWAKIPAEFNFAAADSDGEWYAFITEPKKRKSFWDAKDDLCNLFGPNDVGTLPNVPWEDSLCKRP